MDHHLDLPLHSNIDKVKVTHYILDLTCDIEKKIFSGSVVLILKPVDDKSEVENDLSEDAIEYEILVSELGNFSNSANIEAKNKKFNDKLIEEPKKLNYHKGFDEEWARTDAQLMHAVDSPQTPDSISVIGLKRGNTVDSPAEYSKQNITEIETVDSHPPISTSLTLETKKEIKGIAEELNEIKDSKELVLNQIYKNVEIGTCRTKDNTLVSSNASSGDIFDSKEIKENLELADHSYSTPPLEKDDTDTPDFILILDAWDLQITSVDEICVKNSNCDKDILTIDKSKLKEILENCSQNVLEYTSEKTCLNIWKPGIKHAQGFPKIVRISYQSKPCGSSLKWTSDQDGRSCVYTHGHWINNRSLFPSQDVPGAMATWQSYIHVPTEMTVLMSGDENPVVNEVKGASSLKTFIYYTNLVVPSSTLALAVGYWTEVEIISSRECRCMEAAFSVLGPHPFKRLDLLIVPASFASLGMASPSLLFLSQSLLSTDGHMLVRVAHEISHSWFGLAIGACDWHEEWLSEGFCTYTESIIHAIATQVTNEDFVQERELYDHLKHCVMEAEGESTSEDLQTLRKAGDEANDGTDYQRSCDQSVKYVSNGMNPDKGFLQVHYLKGYFLLRFLEDTVGYEPFLGFLKRFVKEFHHMLIDSMDVLKLFFQKFPHKRSTEFSEETILRDWLNSSRLPLPKHDLQTIADHNRLAREVLQLESKVKDVSNNWKKIHWSKRRKLDMANIFEIPKLKVVQVLVFLDRVLDIPKIHPQVLLFLNETLQLAVSNGDVRHKWCEIVVKNKLEECYKDVRNFLLDHQAMGVYLFGELVITRDKKQRKVAEECFADIRDDMEEGVRKVVQGMVYGT